jgi:hypothetical protein
VGTREYMKNVKVERLQRHNVPLNFGTKAQIKKKLKNFGRLKNPG